jgi:membrane protein implicated in regulation of membrane protease activity
MYAFLKVAGRLGAIIALITLVVTLLRQLIALVGTVLFLIKFGIIALFAGLVLIVIFSTLRARQRRRRDEEEF